MYNEDIKVRFIKERTDTTILPMGYLENQFNKLESTEKELGKDVSNFTAYEIMEYYKMLNVSSADSLRVLNSQLSIYTNWCLNNNLVVDNQNHFLEITYDMFDNLINKVLFDMRIVKREDVLQWISTIKNPRDQFIILGLFEGIRGKDNIELSSLKPSDVNGNEITLYGGRKIIVSDKLRSVIEDCIDTDVYYSPTDRVFPLVDNGYVVKDFCNTLEINSERQLGRRIYNSIKRSLESLSQFGIITAKSIVESGKLDMIKRRAAEHGMTQREYVFSDYIQEVNDQFGCEIMPYIFVKKYSEYLY